MQDDTSKDATGQDATGPKKTASETHLPETSLSGTSVTGSGMAGIPMTGATMTGAGPAESSSGDGIPVFFLEGPRHRLSASGIRHRLISGGLDDLAQRAARFFAAAPADALPLMGAVPYDRHAPDHLFQPVTLAQAPHSDLPARAPNEVPPAAGLAAAQSAAALVSAEPTAAHYREAVSQALSRIAAGEFDKIVLSRSLRLLASQPCDLARILDHLRADPEATAFATVLPALPLQGGGAQAGQSRHLLGATPELLVERRGSRVFSHPLAGSARRQPNAAADRAAGAALLCSDKDLREHAMAAEMVLDTLAPFCAQLAAPEGVALASTARMWHLGTRIEGDLRDRDTPCAELLAALHPTPAICGLPRAPAEAAIPALEGYDRGFYAGAVGWLEANGDGAWYLALRCAEVSGARARLYAGAGVVAGSSPAAEEAETSAKFLAMLAAFGLDETGRPLDLAA